MNDVPNRLGRYQLRYRIALGGMGGVYLARAESAGGAHKVVAVKILHEHMAMNEAIVDMFRDEAKISAALNHANVCATFDFAEDQGIHYLVMEYLEGEPLDRVLKLLVRNPDRHELHPWLVARVVADAAEGLHHAHQLLGADGELLNVVHRDVSPHNVVVTYDGVAKLMDFGIARARERATATQAGEFKGKFEYASPEQIVAGETDRRTDIWALGVVLWELLTGTRLFQRGDFSTTGRAVLNDVIPAPSSITSVPPVFDAICARALQRSPEARFQTAREFGRALRDALASSPSAIDGPLVEEWLESMFPGDRGRRQALAAAVRQSQSTALEPVPPHLKVSDVTSSSSGKSKSLPPIAPPPPQVRVDAPTAPRKSASASSSSGVLPPGGSVPVRLEDHDDPTAAHLAPSAEARVRQSVPDNATREAPSLRRRQTEPGSAPAPDDSTRESPQLKPTTDQPITLETTPHQPVTLESPAHTPKSSAPLMAALAALLVIGGLGAWFLLSGKQVSPTATEPEENPTEVGDEHLAAVTPPNPQPGTEREPEPKPDPEPKPVIDAGQPREAEPVPGPDAGAPTVAPPLLVSEKDGGTPTPKKKKPVTPLAGTEPIRNPGSPTGVGPTNTGRTTGTVRFLTPGGSAELIVDGARVGMTPQTLNLPVGQHRFELKLPGVDFGGAKTVTVSPGSDFNVEVDLR